MNSESPACPTGTRRRGSDESGGRAVRSTCRHGLQAAHLHNGRSVLPDPILVVRLSAPSAEIPPYPSTGSTGSGHSAALTPGTERVPMRAHSRRPLYFLVAGVSFLPLQSRADAQNAMSGSASLANRDAAAIRAELDTMAAGWNRGDLSVYLSGYEDSIATRGPGGFVIGVPAVEKVMRDGYWKTGRPVQTLHFEHFELRRLSSDVAIATGEYVLSGGDQDNTPGGSRRSGNAPLLAGAACTITRRRKGESLAVRSFLARRRDWIGLALLIAPRSACLRRHHELRTPLRLALIQPHSRWRPVLIAQRNQPLQCGATPRICTYTFAGSHVPANRPAGRAAHDVLHDRHDFLRHPRGHLQREVETVRTARRPVEWLCIAASPI